MSQVISFETGAGAQAGYVGIAPTTSGLRVVNQTERPICGTAVNAETLALLDWAPCTGGANCPPLGPGQQREIPWSAVLGYSTGTKQYTVYWWNVTVRRGGTARADNVRNVTITR